MRHLTTVLIVLLGSLAWAEPPTAVPASSFSFENIDSEKAKEAARMADVRDKEEGRITIRQADLFHNLIIERCFEDLPDAMDFYYCGPLRQTRHRRGQRVLGPPAGILEWHFHNDFVIFNVWISTTQNKQTVTACKIEETDIFVNVSFVDEERSVDAKLPELGGASIREVLTHLKKGPITDEEIMSLISDDPE